jgi:crotonobetainyl-CoA:carnitine CoA-transferase CaiB-like acyl-CoA transferase
VIKVESTRRLDAARNGFLARSDGIEGSPIFNELGLSKRSLQIDLTQPEGVEIVQRLAADVDVVVDNFRPGVMAGSGSGPTSCSAATRTSSSPRRRRTAPPGLTRSAPGSPASSPPPGA